MEWISVETELPLLDEDLFTDEVFIKINGKKAKGYYDAVTKMWHKKLKWDMSEICYPTHWMLITEKIN